VYDGTLNLPPRSILTYLLTHSCHVILLGSLVDRIEKDVEALEDISSKLKDAGKPSTNKEKKDELPAVLVVETADAKKGEKETKKVRKLGLLVLTTGQDVKVCK